MPYEADLLLVNANVLTMDPERPTASAVAVAGGRIVGDLRRQAGRDRERRHRPARADAHPGVPRRAQPHDRVRALADRDRPADRQPGRALRAGGGQGRHHSRGGVDHRVRLRPDPDRRPPAPRRARRDRAEPPGLAQAHVQPHVRGEQPRAGRPRHRRDRPAGGRRPGHRRRGRPPHRPARGTRPGAGREPDPSLSAEHADRRGRRGRPPLPGRGHHLGHRGRRRRRLDRPVPGRARRLRRGPRPGQAARPGRADGGQRRLPPPRRAPVGRHRNRHRPRPADRLRRRLAAARPDEDLHRRLARRPHRRHVRPVRRATRATAATCRPTPTS